MAKYFEPAGRGVLGRRDDRHAPDWRVKLRKGDVLSTSATYDTTRGAWWESMGIMVAYMADGGAGRQPVQDAREPPGSVTHGHLAENDNHGGQATSMPDPRQLPDGPENPGFVDLIDFRYQLGDLSLGGPRCRQPAGDPPGPDADVPRRRRQREARIYHSITSCKAPCNRSTGIAYPLADGNVQFESGTLGSETPPATGALQWTTPSNLRPGPTRTSAGSTRSCAVPSGSSSSPRCTLLG